MTDTKTLLENLGFTVVKLEDGCYHNWKVSHLYRTFDEYYKGELDAKQVVQDALEHAYREGVDDQYPQF